MGLDAAKDSLESLLKTLFSMVELRMFVARLPQGAELEAALPWGDVRADRVLHEACGLLQRYGLVNEELFEALLQARPGQHLRICEVARAWGLATSGCAPHEASAPLRSIAFNHKYFTGRDLATIDEALEKGVNGVVLLGPGGVGKTTWAAEYYEHCRQGGRSPVVWLDANNLGGSLLYLCRETLGMATRSPHVLSSQEFEATKEILANQQALVVIDDVRDDRTIEPYIPIFPKGTARLLLTTRDRNLADRIQGTYEILEVPPWILESCRAFATKALEGSGLPPPSDADFERLERMPLAISIACRSARCRPPGTGVGRMVAARPAAGVSAALQAAWGRIANTLEGRVLVAMAVASSGTTDDCVAATTVPIGDDGGIRDVEALDALERLADMGLVHRPRRFPAERDTRPWRMHDLVRRFALKKKTMAADCIVRHRAWVRQTIGDTCQAVGASLQLGTVPNARLEQLVAEGAVAILSGATGDEARELVAGMFRLGAVRLDREGALDWTLSDDLQAMRQRFLDGDPPSEVQIREFLEPLRDHDRVRALNGFGFDSMMRGDGLHAEAYLREALVICRDETQDVFGEATVHGNLGILIALQGHYRLARDELLRFRRLFKQQPREEQGARLILLEAILPAIAYLASREPPFAAPVSL